MRNRIVETESGVFMPQFKAGLFSGWQFYSSNADTTSVMYLWAMSRKDPAKAASFGTLDEAKAFVARVMERANAYWENEWAAKRRALNGVTAKRIFDV